MVSFAVEVPRDAMLVVYSDRATKALYGLMMFAAVLQFLVLCAIAFLAGALELPLLLLLLPVYSINFVFTWPVLREYRALLGPQLAADHTGVWVRTGLGRRPEVVYLPWPVIDGIEATGKGPALRITSRQGEALFEGRAHWRVRTMRRRFGSAFVVDGKRSREHPEKLAHRLWQLGAWAHK